MLPPPQQRFLGLISDTHGLLRPEAITALQGASRILHAGDIGRPEILTALEQIAPVVAVRGNNDTEPWASTVPDTALIDVDGHRLYMLHDVTTLHVDPVAAGYSAIICGHSHRPRIDQYRGVLLINPGSAGPRRFTLPITVARLYIHAGTLSAVLVTLLPESTRQRRPGGGRQTAKVGEEQATCAPQQTTRVR